MNKLTAAKRAAVVAALVEGNSIRATVRMTNVTSPPSLKLLAALGPHAPIAWIGQSVTCALAECKSMRSGTSSTQRRRTSPKKRDTFGYGDAWAWVALDADTKMIFSYRIGPSISRPRTI